MQSATVVAPFLGPEHAAFRDTVRRFVREEITPFAKDRDEAETFPRELEGPRGAAAGLVRLDVAQTGAAASSLVSCVEVSTWSSS